MFVLRHVKAFSNNIEILTKPVPNAKREGPVGSSGEDLHDETFKGQLLSCTLPDRCY